MQPPFDPVEGLLRERPELANGPHMVHIARDLIDMAKTNPRSARRIAAAIMKSSPSKSTCMVTASEALLQEHDQETRREFSGVLSTYCKKPLDEDGDIPDNLGLLDEKKSLKTFLQMAVDYVDAPVDPNQMANELSLMSEQQRLDLAHKIVTGVGPWGYEKEALPIGCDLE